MVSFDKFLFFQLILSLKEYENSIVNMTANCCPMPEPMESIDFSVQIRETQTKEIEIRNDTEHIWCLKPIIMGECFKTADSMTVHGKITETLNITYRPKKGAAPGNVDKVT